jgi:hypothetical protein
MKKILIFGNGLSRLNNIFVNNWNENIWVCNSAYKESLNEKRISLVGSVHKHILYESLEFKEKNSLQYEILLPEQLISSDLKNKINAFQIYNGFSTGKELIQEAILRNYKHIYLAGYDSLVNKGTGDIYYMGLLVISNFLKQFDSLYRKYKFSIKRLENNIILLEMF